MVARPDTRQRHTFQCVEIAETPQERTSERIGVIIDRMDDRHVSNLKEMTTQTVCDELEGVVKTMMLDVC